VADPVADLHLAKPHAADLPSGDCGALQTRSPEITVTYVSTSRPNRSRSLWTVPENMRAQACDPRTAPFDGRGRHGAVHSGVHRSAPGSRHRGSTQTPYSDPKNRVQLAHLVPARPPQPRLDSASSPT
jgi:hypothetical protein